LLLLQTAVSFKAGRHNHSGLELHRQTIRLIRAAAVAGIALLPLTNHSIRRARAAQDS
jgi:hypothetical protein